jgi:hypothetical protein
LQQQRRPLLPKPPITGSKGRRPLAGSRGGPSLALAFPPHARISPRTCTAAEAARAFRS